MSKIKNIIDKNMVFDEFYQKYKTNFNATNMLYKLRIAKELLKNTKNIYLRLFIEKYIANFDEIQSNNNSLIEYLYFDKCIEYIEKSKFYINGWGLWEIPISNIYIFYNKNRKQLFDLIIDDKNIIPAYIDEECNSINANSILEAIEKYDKVW